MYFLSLKINNFFSEHAWCWCWFKIFTTYALITGGSAETYKIVIAYSEKKIQAIKHMGTFCVDKAGFPRLSHMCNSSIWYELILFWLVNLQ